MVHFGIGWLYGYASYYLFGSGSSGLGVNAICGQPSNCQPRIHGRKTLVHETGTGTGADANGAAISGCSTISAPVMDVSATRSTAVWPLLMMVQTSAI
jgi:hypothetical protein